jgi:hypothetical protein
MAKNLQPSGDVNHAANREAARRNNAPVPRPAPEIQPAPDSITPGGVVDQLRSGGK